MSDGTTVILFACVQHNWTSSNRLVRYPSEASYRAIHAFRENLRSALWSVAMLLINLTNGANGIKCLVLCWYLRISLKATVPGLNLIFLALGSLYFDAFLIPADYGLDFLPILEADGFLFGFPFSFPFGITFNSDFSN